MGELKLKTVLLNNKITVVFNFITWALSMFLGHQNIGVLIILHCCTERLEAIKANRFLELLCLYIHTSKVRKAFNVSWAL